jgi:hypothetical protein
LVFDLSDCCIEEILIKGYSYMSTILAFGLNSSQLKMLKDIVKNKTTFDPVANRENRIRIFATDEVTDIYATPFFMAFINGRTIAEDDKKFLMDYWRDCTEPIPVELREKGYSEADFQNPLIYLFDFKSPIESGIPGVHQLKEDVVFDKNSLYLDILSEIKNNEGLGRKASESSIRIYRVLLMYKCLLKEGKLTKKRSDELTFPDVVSKRMFYRDIKVINEIENGKVVYDRNLNAYIIKD